MFFLLAAAGFILSLLFRPYLKSMIVQAGLVKPNYQKRSIPLGLGLIFLFATLITIELALIFKLIPQDNSLVFLFLLFLLGLIGLVDDALGSRHVSGFGGHFTQLWREKKLTTGALKALVGGAGAFLVSFLLEPADFFQFILNGILISLTINFFNLLDLRPGRAIKFFLLLIGLLLPLTWFRPEKLLLAPFLGAVLAYFPLDLQGEGMMGDTGSNLLGGVAGLFLVWNLSLSGRIVILLALIILHFYTEKHSLTDTIGKIKWLRYLDELGRKGEKQNG